jgi:nitrile hydratase
MNGVHDLGGMHGFGPVVRVPDEPVYRAPWEGRVHAMMGQAEVALFGSVPGGRFAIEAVEPVRHLAASYWERWLAALELGALARGLTTREELAARVAHFAAHPEAQAASRARPAPDHLRRDRPAVAAPRAAASGRPERPRFGPGDAIETRHLHPAGHTRLPRYARGHRGEVVRVSPAAGLPDRIALGLAPDPQPVYAVRFAARELWGPDGHPNDAVSLDVWETYLEPSGAAARAARAPRAELEPPPYEALNATGPWWDGGPLPPPEALTAAIESVLLQHGLTDGNEIARRVARAERAGAGPPPAARLVAHAWRDAAFRARLLADANTAAPELGIAPSQRTLVLEDTPRAHHVIVCTLCSCSSSLIGQKPTWYKSPAYRARVVLEPRAVLRELGLGLEDAIAVHVHDTSAEDRYFVLPQCPAGTDGYSEAQLAELVTPEALLGVAVPRPTKG